MGGISRTSYRKCILCLFRRLHGSTLEEVIDSVFAKAPKNSPEVLSMLKNAVLRPCAVALIKVFLHEHVQSQWFCSFGPTAHCSSPVIVSEAFSILCVWWILT